MLVRMWGKGTLIHCWWECKVYKHFGKQYGGFLKTKHRSAIWSSNPTPRDIPEGMWLRLFQRHLHTHVYCSAIHNSQAIKQPRCPSIDKWIKKIWYLYTMEFYSATKKNEILSFTSKWMELENIILSEISQGQKAKNCMFSLTCGL
jgi:hypothetical protein